MIENNVNFETLIARFYSKKQILLTKTVFESKFIKSIVGTLKE